MASPDESDIEVTSGARRVVLARHCADGESDRTVHLVPLPLSGDGSTASALCGVELHAGEVEKVAPGVGAWCTMCFVCHVTGTPAASGTGPGLTRGWIAAAAQYQDMGWPVSARDGALSLDLEAADAVALAVPALLGAEVIDILTARRCAPAVLAHPAVPSHRFILAGEPYPVPLSWPTGVHRVSGTLLLPPTVTADGPLFWVHPPQPDALRTCREFDVCAALCSALRDPHPPASPSRF